MDENCTDWMARGINFYSHECGVAIFSIASVCVFPIRVLTFESFDIKTSFLACRYIFGISRSRSCVPRLWDQGRVYTSV